MDSPRIKYHIVANGAFTHNRAGLKLCEGVQSGQCSGSTSYGRCPRNGEQVHQCCKCLDNRHGATSPTNCTWSPSPSPPNEMFYLTSLSQSPGAKGNWSKGGKGGGKGGGKSDWSKGWNNWQKGEGWGKGGGWGKGPY